MLLPDLHGVRVYLHRAPVDMRRQRNGLAALVRAVINQNPFICDGDYMWRPSAIANRAPWFYGESLTVGAT